VSSIFTITATGAGLLYQWQEDSGSGFKNVNNGGQYSGATTNTLTVSNTTTANHNQQLRCVVASAGCSDTSDAATLYVWPLAVNEVNVRDISIAPNPTKGLFTITSAATIEKVEVCNPLG